MKEMRMKIIGGTVTSNFKVNGTDQGCSHLFWSYPAILQDITIQYTYHNYSPLHMN